MRRHKCELANKWSKTTVSGPQSIILSRPRPRVLPEPGETVSHHRALQPLRVLTGGFGVRRLPEVVAFLRLYYVSPPPSSRLSQCVISFFSLERNI